MNMKLGAEPKKVAILVGLLSVLGVVWMLNSDPSSAPPTGSSGRASSGSAAEADASVATKPGLAAPTAATQQQRLSTRQEFVKQKRQGSRAAIRTTADFKPSLKPDKDNPIDPMQADPTLQFALLQRVQTVGLTGTGRNLFDFSAGPAAAVKMEGPKIVVKPKDEFVKYGPEKPAPPPPDPPKPPPPAIPLKFYGFVSSPRQGAKRAFFMEGEDIFIGGEGDTLKNRYKIVRIGVNSAVLEDTQHQNKQTLPLTEESQANQ